MHGTVLYTALPRGESGVEGPGWLSKQPNVLVLGFLRGWGLRRISEWYQEHRPPTQFLRVFCVFLPR
ncbi:hypothetical protein CesoFtcFv8_001601 [Champsocephalus esox]|uniref:Uncharacterized protein n=2 Tax=Champsocephalus TaxID=52236 RepID=A0AAN8E7C5_CHAGU|nr:hypothetical protein CesoFtcFv8_001601 [Champsocephalus esox]KAK5935982.1 hypothetical protein CgunFtcFv8_021288 [Champsocephalus gunnari]